MLIYRFLPYCLTFTYEENTNIDFDALQCFPDLHTPYCDQSGSAVVPVKALVILLMQQMKHMPSNTGGIQDIGSLINLLHASPTQSYLATLVEETLQSEGDDIDFKGLWTQSKQIKLYKPASHELCEEVHKQIQNVVNIVPTATAQLVQLLVSNFPHKRMDTIVQGTYLRNLLTITYYIPSIKKPILDCTIDRLIQIDVEIKLEDMPDEDELFFETQNDFAFAPESSSSSSLSNGAQDQLDLDTVDDNDNSNSNSNINEDQEDDNDRGDWGDSHLLTSGDKEMDIMAEKLDMMMDLMFYYIRLQCKKRKRRPRKSTQDEEEEYEEDDDDDEEEDDNMMIEENSDEDLVTDKTTDQLFTILIQLFDARILTVHKCKYTQFLMYYICSRNARYTESFLAFLLEKSLEERLGFPMLTRQTCIAYLSSFVARSNFVAPDIVNLVIDHMISWIEDYIEDYDGNGMDMEIDAGTTDLPKALANPEKHTLFYAMCQGLFYIICFKQDMLLTDDDQNDEEDEDEEEEDVDVDEEQDGTDNNNGQHPFFRRANLSKIINSSFNPLSVCEPEVIYEFSSLAQRHGLKGCLHRIRLNEEHRRKAIPLETFFPFDPYLLRDSSKSIQPLYTNWQRSARDQDEDGDDYDQGEADEHDAENQLTRDSIHKHHNKHNSVLMSQESEVESMSQSSGDVGVVEDAMVIDG
eukprot:TRINITY_DN974_c1_g1_i8.p1 TRINITY_DN974_c1_g1~~TRINITY_DN974_c1_g1_i8.p1  ORF type:complete len:693 (-),score=289.69 TRINITY_DN974_c1_g1_i8:61-2139(-)